MAYDDLVRCADSFLDRDPLAVAGVSRSGKEAANVIFRRLTALGRTVWPINPAAETVEGVRCYPSVEALPARPEGLVIATPPAAARALVEACARRGVPRIWMHRGMGPGSVSLEAAELAESLGIEVIAGGCPMMFGPSPDAFHRCLRWFLRVGGRLPDVRPAASGGSVEA